MNYSPLFRTGDIIGLVADNGKYLGRCNGCISGVTDCVSVEASSMNIQTQWKVQVIKDNIISLQSVASGNYLGYCNGCATSLTGSTENAIAKIDDNSASGSWDQWVVEIIGYNKILLKSLTNGKYLARCNACVQSPVSSWGQNFAFVHVTDGTQPYTQWTVNFISKVAGGIKTKNGNYIFTDYGALSPKEGFGFSSSYSQLHSFGYCYFVNIFYCL
jgi:hypothetical protein